MKNNWKEEFNSMFNWAEQIKESELERWELMYGFVPNDIKNFIESLLEEQKKELIEEILAYIYKNEQWDRDEHYPLEIIYTNGLKKILNDKNHD